MPIKLKRTIAIIVPGCHEKLILKRGLKKVAHFAHPRHGCQLFSEGESDEHLEGKKFIYHELKQAGWQVQYEAYQSELHQRPDILGQKAGCGLVAFEYQCAPISFQKLVYRSRGYKQGRLAYIWILGKRYFLKGRLTQQNAMFMHWAPNLGFYLLFLDIARKRFEIDYAIQQADFLPLKYLRHYVYSFQELVAFLHARHEICYYPLTAKQIMTQEYKFQQQIYYGSKSLASLRAYCYTKGLTLADLPKQIFIDSYHPPLYRKPLLVLRSFQLLDYQDTQAVLKDSLYLLPFVRIKPHLASGGLQLT